jgi:uncharacterized small protein (DUF1192 family)
MNTIISLEELVCRVGLLEKEIEKTSSNLENALTALDDVKDLVRLLKKQEDEQLSKKRLV